MPSLDRTRYKTHIPCIAQRSLPASQFPFFVPALLPSVSPCVVLEVIKRAIAPILSHLAPRIGCQFGVNSTVVPDRFSKNEKCTGQFLESEKGRELRNAGYERENVAHTEAPGEKSPALQCGVRGSLLGKAWPSLRNLVICHRSCGQLERIPPREDQESSEECIAKIPDRNSVKLDGPAGKNQHKPQCH